MENGRKDNEIPFATVQLTEETNSLDNLIWILKLYSMKEVVCLDDPKIVLTWLSKEQLKLRKLIISVLKKEVDGCKILKNVKSYKETRKRSFTENSMIIA